MLATAKHFAGDGLTTYGTGSNNGTMGDYPIDQGVDQVSRTTFDRLALAPYVPAVRRHHVGSVMPSYSDVDWTGDGLGNPINMHGNKQLITGWLKQQQGFDGFVISDYEGIHHIQPGVASYATQVTLGVSAGIDMFMEPFDFATFITDPQGAGRQRQRADGAHRRRRLTHPHQEVRARPVRAPLHRPHAPPRHRLTQPPGPGPHGGAEVAGAAQERPQRAADRQGRPIYVAGSNADNIGNQAGGWTLTWQGGSTNVIPGQTILDGIRAAAPLGDLQRDGLGARSRSGAVGVVVVGETPYSEGFGDVGGPRWGFDPGDNGQLRPEKTMQLSAADSAAVDRVCAAAVKCVVVVVSGRPIVIPPAQLSRIDGLVASWLPGSEGGGVADVLLGKARFTGKLPVTWPRSVAQEPINVGDRNYRPAFPYGWGLRTR